MSKLRFYKTVLFTELAQALGQPGMKAEKGTAVEEFIARTVEVILEKESAYSALLARVARLEETLQFILNECDWEPTHHESGGDERIGTAARRALEGK